MKTPFFAMLVVVASFMFLNGTLAQENTTRNNAFYVEFFGNGLAHSVNYDHLFRGTSSAILATRIGLGYKTDFLGRGKDVLSIPLEMTVMINVYGNVNFLELGYGYTLANFSDKYDAYNVGYITLRGGYRYQHPNEWFMMRIGITPMYDIYISPDTGKEPNKTWNLMAGVSFGVAF